ncbi:MAG: SpvB/TcaC N-terminal domain-containing protein [Candidatus Methanofastidiosia archaeon]
MLNSQRKKENQKESADGGRFRPPAISLPKGGGAIRGIDEKFSVNPATGTASLSVSIFTTPGRSDFYPKLLLSYDSGAGNGPFGLGWNLSVPSIARKTDKGIPKYEDTSDSDTFILSGAEDLVPLLVQQGDDWDKDIFNPSGDDGELYTVQRYRPRIEGLFARIERWEHNETGAVHWRSVTKDNVTSIYGRSSNSRIVDPDNESNVFRWVLEETYDDKGNVTLYEYKQENYDNVDLSLLHEKNRLASNMGCSNKYLKCIKYGNKIPFERDNWLFEVVFDYGEHDLVTPEVDEAHLWPNRQDAFSSYRAGFEIRTYRLCQRVLIFHHFPELGDTPCLVRSTEFDYEENPVATYLVSVTQSGYIRNDEGFYQKKSLPPLEFAYTKPEISEEVHFIDAESLENLPMGVDGSQYQWVDLDGEGISGVLTEQGGAWFYKRNLGDAQFAPVQLVASKPSLAYLQGNQQQIMDLAGDGQKDLVVLSRSLQGFYERNDDCWESFTPFLDSPKISWNDPNLRFIDLNGDGHADILMTRDEAFVWYPSQGEKGFGPSETVWKFTDEENGPVLVFADGTQSIYLADMTGDGLTDIVRIRNGDVCYWPNLGYGRFGAKATMGDAPHFDHSELFDQKRIRLADTDGSGTTDIVYLGRDCVTFWFNQAGNNWSEPHELYTFPAVDNLSFVTVVDLLGNGTACIVWSSPMHQDTDQPMCYIDLMGGTKPHLLKSLKNNMGGETNLEYGSSTKFYLGDLTAGNPWITKLFFPVHVVERVETRDHVTKTKLVTLYGYHHGYYDGEEREFRGFGLVEQWDTESFVHFNEAELFSEAPARVEEEFFVPPVYTKTWFHTGAYQDGTNISQHYIAEYYADDYFGDPSVLLLPDTVLPQELTQRLTTRQEREACRALKGRILRQEVYALDDSPKSQVPYSVSERTYQIEMIQPVQNDQYAVFYVYESEAIDSYYERSKDKQGKDDPRTGHKITLDVDDYGNVTKFAVIGYPRRTTTFDEQKRLLMTYTESVFKNMDDSKDFYRAGVPIRTKTYEVVDVQHEGNTPFTLSKVRTILDDPDSEMQYERRLMECTRTLYYKDDLSGPLPFGEVEPLAIPYESYQMVFTPGLIDEVYGSRIDSSLLVGEGKYLFWDDAWWVPSGRYIFDPAQFYLPIEFIDPFDQRYLTTYDSYHLLIEETEDPLGNTVKAENNYRTILPELVFDPNDNRSAVQVDELGMVVATAVMGKEGQDEGDTLDNPTISLEYNLSNWREKELPNFVYTRAREQHGAANPRWQESYTYSDGSGREVMTKIQAEPGLAPGRDENGDLLRDENDNLILVDTSPNVRWVGTGRTVFDNKGNPIKKYEPFFSSTHEYEDEKDLVEWGFTPIFHYDPLSRLIRTDYPNGTFSKVEFSAWQQETWDQNDTALESEWYNERKNLPSADPEGRAAQLTAEHAETPQVAHLDVLGRTFLTIADNKDYGQFETHVTLDIKGNQIVVTDARGNEAMVNMFDMLNQRIYLNSVDAGERWMVNNVAGNPIRTWDSRGHQIRHGYDEIQRQTYVFVKKETNLEFLGERTVYGEAHPNAVLLNLRKRIHQQYDQAGVITNEKYDFKGNLLCNSRRLAKIYKNTVDWSVLADLTSVQDIANASAPLLETEAFTSSTEYDALNRPVHLITPDNSKIRPTYNESNLLEKMDIQLRGGFEWTSFVTNINYNAKGQRELIRYGNGVYTEYKYDPFTFRLTNLKTIRAGNILQNLSYTYDPVGNITKIQDEAQQTVFFDNAMVSPDAQYKYDALYRLIQADGREHAGQTSGMQRDHTDFPRMVLHHPNNGQAMRRYTEKYEYDEVGNISLMVHQAIDGNWTRQYQYASNNSRLLSTSLPNDPDDGPFSAEYCHDANGNMICMPHLAEIQWDFRDQMCQIDLGGGGTAYYVYNAGGERVRRVVERLGALKEERIYLGIYEIFRRHNGSGLKLERETLHVMDDRRRIALVETKAVDEGTQVPSPVPLIRYQLNNHLGSSCLELDEFGKIISYEEYYPYGNTSYHAVQSDVEVSVKRYRYTGKERDNETGLYYHGTRFYASWLGRWASCDPAGMVDGTNLYRFTRNNPVKFIDSRGNQSEEDITKLSKTPILEENDTTELNTTDKENITKLNMERIEEVGKEATFQGTADYVEALARIFEDKEITDLPFKNPDLTSAQKRLRTIFDATESLPRLLFFGGGIEGWGTEGFGTAYEDPHPSSSNQVGHFLTAVNLGYNWTRRPRVFPEEIAIILMIGHEKVPDFQERGSFFGKKIIPTSLKEFWAGYITYLFTSEIQMFQIAENVLEKTKYPENAFHLLQKGIGVDKSKSGCSYEDLRLSLMGFHLGKLIKEGTLRDPSDVAKWIRTNLKINWEPKSQ